MLPLICTVHKIALPSLWGFLLPETQEKCCAFTSGENKWPRAITGLLNPGLAYLLGHILLLYFQSVCIWSCQLLGKGSCSQIKKVIFLMLYIINTERQTHCSTSSIDKSRLLCNFINKFFFIKDWNWHRDMSGFHGQSYWKGAWWCPKEPESSCLDSEIFALQDKLGKVDKV